jgi:hypothetical protein
MDRVDKANAAPEPGVRGRRRTLLPPCQGTVPAKMARLLEQLDDDKENARFVPEPETGGGVSVRRSSNF